MFDAPLLCYAGFQLSRIYWNLKTENKEQRTENWNHSFQIQVFIKYIWNCMNFYKKNILITIYVFHWAEYVVEKIVKLYFRQSEKVKQSLAHVCFILETYKIVRKI